LLKEDIAGYLLKLSFFPGRDFSEICILRTGEEVQSVSLENEVLKFSI
jgi:hypothetical protein